jgi:hypothetical protein
VLAHDARFLRVERPTLQQDVIGHRDLADVVQKPAALKRVQIAARSDQARGRASWRTARGADSDRGCTGRAPRSSPPAPG